MKAKTIKAVLHKKVSAWIESIEDKALQDLAEKNTIVTGGAIASMLLGEKVSDFDIYFQTKEACKAIAKYYVKKFLDNPPLRFRGGKPIPIKILEEDNGRIKIVVKSAGIANESQHLSNYAYFEQDPDPDALQATEYVEHAAKIAEDLEREDKPPFRPVFLTSNAITLSDKIQLVIRFYGSPDVIHENYDFVHCMNYWTSWDNKLVLRQPALEALLARELRYVGSKYPLCSIIRTRKFIRRDWAINAGQYLKMAMQLNELDLTDVSVLEEQLVGVDTAYFLEVIAKLRNKDPKKVDSAYLLEIIDRIF